MKRKAHLPSHRRTYRIDPAASLRSQKRVHMTVSPHIDMCRKERRQHPQFFHSVKLILSCSLAMDNKVPCFFVCMWSLRKSIQYHIQRRITIAVYRECPPGLSDLIKRLFQFLLRHSRITAIPFRLWTCGVILIIRNGQIRRVCLNAPICDQFHRPVNQPLPIFEYNS